MNLRDLARRIFGGTSGLRNKPGGLAYIHCPRGACEDLHGRVVTTVSANWRGHWTIEPQQTFVMRGYGVTRSGVPVGPGDTLDLVTAPDASLIPIRNPGDEERSEELAWQPKVPAPGKVAA